MWGGRSAPIQWLQDAWCVVRRQPGDCASGRAAEHTTPMLYEMQRRWGSGSQVHGRHGLHGRPACGGGGVERRTAECGDGAQATGWLCCWAPGTLPRGLREAAASAVSVPRPPGWLIERPRLPGGRAERRPAREWGWKRGLAPGARAAR